MILETVPRQRAGTGAARAVRRQGMVPGVIYGRDMEPVLMAMSKRQAEIMMENPGLFSTVYDVRLGERALRVLTRDVQLDPLKDQPIHIDFMAVTDETTLVVNVRVRFINHAGSPGLKRGGILNVVLPSLPVRCAIRSLPDFLEIDLNERALGESLPVSTIQVAEGVEILAAPSDVVATIAITGALRRKVMDEG